jgi:hypothetical protein
MVSVIRDGIIQVDSTVLITAEIWACIATADWVDFYYATDAQNHYRTKNPWCSLVLGFFSKY